MHNTRDEAAITRRSRLIKGTSFFAGETGVAREMSGAVINKAAASGKSGAPRNKGEGGEKKMLPS